MLGIMLGTFVGPYLLEAIGYFGTYSIRIGLQLIVLLYFIFAIKNDKVEKVIENKSFEFKRTYQIGCPYIHAWIPL